MSDLNAVYELDANLREAWRACVEHTERELNQLRTSAVTLAEHKGLIVDDIDREALTVVISSQALAKLVVMLAVVSDVEEVREVWTSFFRSEFGRIDYRLRVEIRRFVKQRQESADRQPR
ncbi:MAG TPA: hypothetical protein VGC42_06810 [Kofleriaceae bacterium]